MIIHSQRITNASDVNINQECLKESEDRYRNAYDKLKETQAQLVRRSLTVQHLW